MKMKFERGNLISYSASTTQSDPWGFRIVKNDNDMFSSLIEKYPEIISNLSTENPLFLINCYPAPVANFNIGIMVETYLSKKIAHRSIRLAEEANLTIILIGQPLFLAEVIFSYLKIYQSFPSRVLISTGGYEMPYTLEKAIDDKLKTYCKYHKILHGYGTAEVDMACFLSMERDEDKNLIYTPRSDKFKLNIKNDRLYLSMLGNNGEYIIENFDTGDSVCETFNGFLIKNELRFDDKVRNLFLSWSNSDWERRTGYLCNDNGIKFQLRKGEKAIDESEMSYFEFAEKIDFEWLNKPIWRY